MLDTSFHQLDRVIETARGYVIVWHHSSLAFIPGTHMVF